MSKKKREITLSGDKSGKIVLFVKFRKKGGIQLRVFEADPSGNIGKKPNYDFYKKKDKSEALVVINFVDLASIEKMLSLLSRSRDSIIFNSGKAYGMEQGFDNGAETILSTISEISSLNPEQVAETVKGYMDMLEKSESMLNKFEELLVQAENNSLFTNATDEQKEKIKQYMRTGKEEIGTVVVEENK